MRKTLTSNELETMISKCVGQVLAESKQKQAPRRAQKRVLTESQLQSYIQNVINEEMENELFDKTKGELGFLWNKVKGKGEQLAKSGQQKITNIKKGIEDFGTKVNNKVDDVKTKANTFVKDMKQAGNNASFIADTQKLAQEVEQISQKYGNNLSKWPRACLQNASKALNSLVQSCQNGEMNA